MGRLAFAVVTLLFLGACASSPPPAPTRLVSARPAVRITLPPSPTPTPSGPAAIDPALDLGPPGAHQVDRVTRASPTPIPDYSVPCVWTRGSDSNKVALVFDVGARASNIRPLLDALAQIGQRVTLAVSGEFARQNPDLYRLAARDGHEVILHGMFHTDLTPLATGLLLRDIADAERTLAQAAGGRAPTKVVRLPFGNGTDDERVRTAICGAGFKLASWEVGDAGAQEGYDPKSLGRDDLAGLVTGGRIIYLKSTGTDNARALANLVGLLDERGLVATTLTDLIGLPQTPWTKPVWPRPSEAPSASPSASGQPLPTSSATPIGSPYASPSPTPSASPSASPTPSATPPAAPTATP